MSSLLNRIFGDARHADGVFAVGIIGILGVMIIPMPTFLMDLLLTFNISLALIVLVNALYVKGPLQMSVFPSLMLVVTLFRLALNVASTRLILGQAYAGKMISAFGGFVVKDNYVVGAVIFIILVVIQYVVIVKGTERNAEVGARFTLDAMPGKQMSIDADLNAGLINEEEALRRREELSREANFYGAMDGASKFVRGDAIAGIVITLVNILAGFVVGVVQLGMTPDESLQTYTRLTIGDGLVSQIPALVVSTSAGIVVSRASADSGIGTEVLRQLFTRHVPKLVVSGALAVLAMIPGIPAVPLLMLAAALAGITWWRSRRPEVAADVPADSPVEAEPTETPEDYLHVDRIELAVGYGLVPLMDKDGGSDFLDRVVSMRKQLAKDLGILVPRIRVRDDIRLQPDRYEIRLRGHKVAEGSVRVGHWLAIGDREALAPLEGVDTKEPAFGIDAKWVRGAARTRAEDLGLTVVPPSVVLATHLTETLKQHAWEILSRQDVKGLIDQVEKESPDLIKDVVPDVVTLGTVHRVLQNLLKEGVPVRDLGGILEVLADFAPQVKEVDLLSEYVRASLGREIVEACLGTEGEVEVISVDPALEQRLGRMFQDRNGQAGVGFTPQEIQRLLGQVSTLVRQILDRGKRAAILCSPAARLPLRRLLEAQFPKLPVLSYPELGSEREVTAVGMLSLANTPAAASPAAAQPVG